jgi:hypothetical protein
MKAGPGAVRGFSPDPAGMVERGKSSFQLFCKPV